MKPLKHLAPFLLAATTNAAEITLEEKPFYIDHGFTAVALPSDGLPLMLDAKAWTDFQLSSLAAHGSKVKKDEPLFIFNSEEIDRRIPDTREAVASQKIKLTQAELELANMEKNQPVQLARLERAATEAAEEYAYFNETRRVALESTANQSLRRATHLLDAAKEELRQLKMMYRADDLTEETEEIILERQRNSVVAAEHALAMETLNHLRTLEVTLPRQAIDISDKKTDTAEAHEKAIKELPRNLELKKIEVAGMKTALARAEENLAQLETDRKLFEIKAPQDGWFYHGSIEDGKWVTGEIIRTLIPNGRPPVLRTLATFIPANADLLLHASLDEATARVLAPQTKGSASLAGREDLLIAATLESLAPTPRPDQTYTAVFSADFPKDLSLFPGQSMQINLISHTVEKAITVPAKALRYDPRGWTVEVKLADGKTERRVVRRGRTNKEEVEILDGLEAGQVVIIP